MNNAVLKFHLLCSIKISSMDKNIGIKLIILVSILRNGITFMGSRKVSYIDDEVFDKNMFPRQSRSIKTLSKEATLNRRYFGKELHRENHDDEDDNNEKKRFRKNKTSNERDHIKEHYRLPRDLPIDKPNLNIQTRYGHSLQSEDHVNQRNRREVIDLQEAAKIRNLIFHGDLSSHLRKTRNTIINNADTLRKLDYSMEDKWKIERDAHAVDNFLTRIKRITVNNDKVKRKSLLIPFNTIASRVLVPARAPPINFQEESTPLDEVKRDILNLPLKEAPY